MENRIPSSIPALRGKAGAMAIGANQYAATIPLSLNTEADIRADNGGLGDAVTAVGTGRDELKDRRVAVEAAVTEGRAFLMAARDSFKPENGNEYNEGWDSSGLNSSLEIPRNRVLVLALLGSFKAYLTSHANLEVATKSITAARAGELFTQLETAMGAVSLQKAHLKNLVRDRDLKVAALRKRLRDTIAELAIKLGPLDAKWLAFGLNMPGAVATPPAPTNVVAVLIGSTSAAVKWDASARAKYYRVWIRTAVDQPWVPVGNPADLDFTVEELLRNTKTEIAVSAVNAGGESALSAITSVTTLP